MDTSVRAGLTYTVNSIDTIRLFRSVWRQVISIRFNNFSWKEKLGKRWKLYAGISYTFNQDDIKRHAGSK